MNELNRSTFIRGAAWSVPVVAMAAAAPAFAASPSVNNSLFGWVSVDSNGDDWNLNGNRNQGTYQGAPYGLYVLGTNAADTISNAFIELDIAGNNNLSWPSAGTGWTGGSRQGTITRNEDGVGGLTRPVTFTRYRFNYSGPFTSITSGGVERKWLNDFVVNSSDYNSPDYNGNTADNRGGETIWMRRFVTVNNQQRFFERRQGDMGFVDYYGGPAIAARSAAGATTSVV